MRRKLFWLPLTILIVLSGVVLMLFCFGRQTIPLSREEAKQIIDELGFFDSNQIEGISGSRYRCGFWEPNIDIHFTISQTGVKIPEDEKTDPYDGPPNLDGHLDGDGHGVPSNMYWDYCWIGMEDGKYMGQSVCTYGRYCIVTPPDQLGMVDVYYVLSGGM